MVTFSMPVGTHVCGSRNRAVQSGGIAIQSVEIARAKWKSVSDAGVTAQYWSQESGNWQKKASANET